MGYDAAQPAELAVGILLFDDVEVLDFCGPFEVFSTAGHVAVAAGVTMRPPFRVFTLAEKAGSISARGNLLVQPHYTITDHPAIDILVVPGGQGTRREVSNARLIEWIRGVTQTTHLTTSVCTGAFLLGIAGLLDGHRATTHWASLDRLADAFPGVTIERARRWVDEGTLVTSAGISAGIDMSLHLVERCVSREVALATARHMEYQWSED